MKTEELMIGDWVNIFPLSHRLEPTSGEVIMIGVNWVKTSEGSYDEELIDPIPLTAEILLANGFVEKNGALVYSEEDEELGCCEYVECHIYNETLISIKIVYWKSSFDVDMAYSVSVHEFQHALRLCGLSYLADNFKIK